MKIIEAFEELLHEIVAEGHIPKRLEQSVEDFKSLLQELENKVEDYNDLEDKILAIFESGHEEGLVQIGEITAEHLGLL